MDGTPWQETSSAQYIVRQYMAATGAAKAQGGSIHNSYAAGKVKMITTEHETAKKVIKTPAKSAENGWFVLWQMMPDKWYMELALEDCTIQAGCDGKLVWRHAPWLGVHAAKGPVRPLRRALQVRAFWNCLNVFFYHAIPMKKQKKNPPSYACNGKWLVLILGESLYVYKPSTNIFTCIPVKMLCKKQVSCKTHLWYVLHNKLFLAMRD